MKLARVIHVSCNQRSWDEPETYVWVDDAMTQDEFTELAKLARNAYDQAGEEFTKAEPAPHCEWGMPSYDRYPDKTVAEVKAAYDAKHAQYEAWKKLKQEAQATFGHHLKAVGNGRILQFWEQKPALDFALQWGHRHGQNIQLGETEFHDLPGTVATEQDWP